MVREGGKEEGCDSKWIWVGGWGVKEGGWIQQVDLGGWVGREGRRVD